MKQRGSERNFAPFLISRNEAFLTRNMFTIYNTMVVSTIRTIENYSYRKDSEARVSK